MNDALRVEGLYIERGDANVCRDVSLKIPAGEITVVFGANGAGKSTLLNGIAGVYPATGAILLNERRIDAMPMHRRSAQGLSYVEQGRSVFTRLTVAQNIRVVDSSRRALDEAFRLFPQLECKRHVRAGFLSGGEQQMLMIARALSTKPKFLLVDELSLGLAPRLVEMLMKFLSTRAESGLGILLVEQFVDSALEIGTMGHVMQKGSLVRSERCSVLRDERATGNFGIWTPPSALPESDNDQ